MPANTEFTIDTSNSDLLCSDEMIADLLLEIEDFPGSVLDNSDKLAELKVLARSRLELLTGKKILWKDYVVEKYDGNEKPMLYLRHTPILAVTLVEVTCAGTTTTLVPDTDYWIYEDHLYFANILPRGHYNVAVSYRAGIHNTVTTGNTVSLSTARVISLMAARHVVIDLASGPAQSQAISAGPVSLRESFDSHGQHGVKLQRWSDEVDQWVRSKAGVRMRAVGNQRFPRSLRREFVPRLDRWVSWD